MLKLRLLCLATFGKLPKIVYRKAIVGNKNGWRAIVILKPCNHQYSGIDIKMKTAQKIAVKQAMETVLLIIKYAEERKLNG